MNTKLIRILLIIFGVLIIIGAIYYFLANDSSTVSTTQAKTAKNQKEHAINSPFQTNTPINKMWTIDFENEINPNSLKAAYVLDSNGDKSPVEFTTTDKRVYVVPPKNGYKAGEHYEIHIPNKVTFTTGKHIPTSIRIDFITKSEEVVQAQLSNKVKVKPGVALYKGDTYLISKNEKVNVGDIIIYTDPTGKKLARKVTKLGDKGSLYTLETQTPTLMEIYDKLHVHKSFEITADNFHLVPQQGVSLSQEVAYHMDNLYASSGPTPKEKPDYSLVNSVLKGEINPKWKQNKLVISFKDFGLEDKKNGLKINLNGDVKVSPSFDGQIDGDFLKLKTFNLSSNLDTSSKIDYTLSTKNLKGYDKNITLGEANIPIAGAPYLEMKCKLLLHIHFDAKDKPTFTLTTETHSSSGIVMERDGNFQPFAHSEPPNYDVDYKPFKGSAEFKAGAHVDGDIEALGVVGAGLYFESGPYLAATFDIPASDSKQYPCGKLDFGWYSDGGFNINLLDWEKDFSLFPEKQALMSTPKCPKTDEKTGQTVSNTPKQDYVELPLPGSASNKSIKLPKAFADSIKFTQTSSGYTFEDPKLPVNSTNLGTISSISNTDYLTYSKQGWMIPNEILPDGNNIYLFRLPGDSINQQKIKEGFLLEQYILNSGFQPDLYELRDWPDSDIVTMNSKETIKQLIPSYLETLKKYLTELKGIQNQTDWNAKVPGIPAAVNQEAYLNTQQVPIPQAISHNLGEGYRILKSLQSVDDISYINAQNDVLRLEKIVNKIEQQITEFQQKYPS